MENAKKYIAARQWLSYAGRSGWPDGNPGLEPVALFRTQERRSIRSSAPTAAGEDANRDIETRETVSR